MGNGQETKTRLLRAALDLIWRSSFGSVSVDDICEEAGVLKGSFYHFFPSKVDLAIEAVKFSWNEYCPEIDAIYSPDNPPLKRLSDHCDLVLKKQKELLDTFGFVPGCPFTALGSEQSTQSEKLQHVIESHMDYMKKYFSSAIADAVKQGDIPETNVKKKTSEVFSLYLGSFTHARITNDLQPVRNLKNSLMTLLGARTEAVH